MKIGIFTQYDDAFEPVADITVPVMLEYARRHGYDLHVRRYTSDGPPVRSVVWDRYLILSNAANGYDLLVHLDADVLLTNHKVRIEELWEMGAIHARNYDAVMSACPYQGSIMLNDGVAIFRGSPDVRRKMFEVFQSPEADGIWCGQDVLNGGRVDMHIALLEQRSLNAFLYAEYGMDWPIGEWWRGASFALHLPGMKNERRVEILEKYRKEIVI